MRHTKIQTAGAAISRNRDIIARSVKQRRVGHSSSGLRLDKQRV